MKFKTFAIFEMYVNTKNNHFGISVSKMFAASNT